MQVKKQFFKILKSLSLIVILASCKKDFLDGQGEDGVLLREDYVVDLRTTKEYLNGTYVALSTDVFEGYNSIYPELVADNVKPALAASGSAPMLNQYNWNQSADNAQTSLPKALNCNNVSYACYRVVRYTNFIIASSDKYRMQDTKLSDQIKGQALALRAFSKLLLLDYFAQPYSFTADASHPGIALFSSWDPIGEKLSRSSAKDSYQSIIDDLLKAIELLDSGTFEKYAFSKLSAMAMLSRVYLYTNNYEKSKEHAIAVIKQVPLMTSGYPEKLFTADNTESLFELPPGTSATLYNTLFSSVYYRFRQFYATGDIADLLNEDADDKRKSWVNQVSGNWQVTKFPMGAVAGAIIPQAGYYQPIIRSSELYLTASEAYMQLGNSDSAIYYLDIIRNRANQLAPATNVSGEELKETIYKERRKELAFEGQRMFDLLRWKKDITRSDALPGSPNKLSYPNDKLIAPISTIDVNRFGISQNSGY